MAWRKASSSNIAFARSTEAYATAWIIAIRWAANARITMTFIASWKTSWNTDAAIAMAYWTACW